MIIIIIIIIIIEGTEPKVGPHSVHRVIEQLLTVAEFADEPSVARAIVEISFAVLDRKLSRT